MKIYTYKSPFEITKMNIWQSIKTYPHLCVSQTLVEGLKEYYGREEFSVLCTIDSMLKVLYKDWHDDTENDIEQNIKISNAIRALPDQPLKETFKYNQKDVYKAIRYLIESDISPEIDSNGLPTEQQLFLELYKKVASEKAFGKLNQTKKMTVSQLHEGCTEILRQELKKYIREESTLDDLNKLRKKKMLYDQRLLEGIEQRIKSIKDKLSGVLRNKGKTIALLRNQRSDKVNEQIMHGNKELQRIATIRRLFLHYRDESYLLDYSKIVLHGVHQFTPLILRLIRDLEQMGIEVIFIFNYMSEYEEIYKTWKNVYEWVNHGEMIEEGLKAQGEDYLKGRELGYALASIYEGDFSKIESSYGIQYTAFDNLTSFSDYVSQKYKPASAKVDKKYKGKELPQNHKLLRLAGMDEQFYAINGTQTNELLKIYFPEQFSSRHFLSYPVGQFIRSLYKMWDEHKETIHITEEHIKEALALHVWNEEGKPTPLEMFYNLKHCFKTKTDFEGYLEVLENIKRIVRGAKDLRRKRMSFFIYTPEEIEYFIQVIKDIKLIAESLFSKKTSPFRKHYEKLIQRLLDTEAINSHISQEELKFIEDIKEHISKLEQSTEQVHITDIKNTIGYYLESNTNSMYEAEWIVRDFEQIDGGVLLAEAQKRDEEEIKPSNSESQKVFHYAGLSDENMLGKTKVQLPWPLDEDLFYRVNSKVAEICSVCRSEYNYFLRYSLFYGTYFLTEHKQIALSYIKNLGDKEASPYSTLSLINIRPEDAVIDKEFGKNKPEENYDNHKRIEVTLPETDSEKRSMRACFKRYLFNHCLDQDTYFNDDYYLDQICKFFIQYAYIKNHRENRYGNTINETELNRFFNYFPFFLELDKLEIKKAIQADLDRGASYSSNNQQQYIDSKMEFIYRAWKVKDEENAEEVNVFKYFMGKQSHDEFMQVFKEFDQFVEEDQPFVKRAEHKEKVCGVCNQRYLCVERSK